MSGISWFDFLKNNRNKMQNQFMAVKQLFIVFVVQFKPPSTKNKCLYNCDFEAIKTPVSRNTVMHLICVLRFNETHMGASREMCFQEIDVFLWNDVIKLKWRHCLLCILRKINVISPNCVTRSHFIYEKNNRYVLVLSK